MSQNLHIEEGICILATHSVGQGPGPTHLCVFRVRNEEESWPKNEWTNKCMNESHKQLCILDADSMAMNTMGSEGSCPQGASF